MPDYQQTISEPQHQHPVAALTNVLDLVRRNLFTLFIIFFLSGQRESTAFFNLFFLGVTLVVLLIYGVLSWQRFTFQVQDNKFVIKYGVISTNTLSLTTDRIQVIDISAGPVQRLFGLVRVKIQTAGASSKETEISAISRERAEQLRNILRSGKAEPTVSENKEEEIPAKEMKLSAEDLVLTASTSGRIGIILSIGVALFGRFSEFFSESEIYAYLNKLTESVGLGMTFYQPVMVALGILVLAWVASFVSTFVAFSGFTLSSDGKELHIKRGMLENQQLTLPYNRIQAIKIEEGVFRQPFGLMSLSIESAGYGEEQSISTSLYPILRKKDLPAFIEEILPGYDLADNLVRPPQRALRRYLIRSLLIPVLAASAVSWFFPYGYLAFLVLPFAATLGWLRFRDARIGVKDNLLVVQQRTFALQTSIIKKNRIQDTDLSSNFFQRRASLSNFGVSVASGRGGAHFDIRDIDQHDGESFFQWVAGYVKTEEVEDQVGDQIDAE
jgi:putative membrane protein